MMRGTIVCLVLIGLGSTGCGPPPKNVPPQPVAEVDAIELYAPFPPILNWDNSPGPDGVQVIANFYRVGPTRTEAIAVSGVLEFLLFEGKVDPQDLSSAKPFHIWTYQPHELPQFLTRGSLGLWGYRMRLGWGNHIPRSERVTLTVRYTAPGRQVIYAKPITITMTEK